MNKKTYFGWSAAFLLGALLMAPTASVAQTIRAVGDFLQVGDVRTTHILNGTILDTDISAAAAIGATKVAPRGPVGAFLYGNNTQIGTSSQSWYDATSQSLVIGSTTPSQTATSTGSGFFAGTVQAGTIEATSTLKLRGVSYTPPSADGGSGYTLQTNGSGALSWAASAASYLQKAYTAGEAISAGNAVYMASTTNAITVLTIATTNNSEQSVGTGAGASMHAQSFSGSDVGRIEKVTIKVKKTGAPVDSLQIDIEGNSAGAPNGVSVASSTILGSSLTTSAADYTLTLNNAATLTAATTYWVKLSRTGSFSGVNYYEIAKDSGNPYANGSDWYYNGSIWQDTASDDNIIFIITTAAGNVYKADANATGIAGAFFGVAPSTCTYSASCNVQFAGEATGLSGLTTGIGYYLSDTAAALSATAGTVSRKVCLATSATTCLITTNW